MPGAGTVQFTDAEDYQASLPYAAAQLVVTEAGGFDARLTWAKLANLHLLRATETLARVAYISLPAQSLFVSLQTRLGTTLYWNGVELQPGNILFHGRGERLHQRTVGASGWGFLAIAPDFLASYGSALAGRDLPPPVVGQVLRPLPADLARLLRLHSRVAHLVETRPVALCHPELGRAMEQELLHTLVACLAGCDAQSVSNTRQRHVRVMARFEEVVADHLDRPLRVRDLCAILAISDRTLRTCCGEFLGMGPNRYLMLRRLGLVRTAMRCADPATARIGDIAGRFGFTEIGRFAVAYRQAFGETPSMTLRRPRGLGT